MDEKKISKAEYDKAVVTVMSSEMNDPALEGMGKILVPTIGIIFAQKIAAELFGEKEN